MFPVEVRAISGNVSDRSVVLVEGKEWNIWSVSRCMRGVAVDRVCSFTLKLLCWSN
jgi:hypothetical protein